MENRRGWGRYRYRWGALVGWLAVVAPSSVRAADPVILVMVPPDHRDGLEAALRLELMSEGAIVRSADPPTGSTLDERSRDVQRQLARAQARAAVWVEGEPDGAVLHLMDEAGWVRRVVRMDTEARAQAILVSSFLSMRDGRRLEVGSQPPLQTAAPAAPVPARVEPEPASQTGLDREKQSPRPASRFFFGVAPAMGFGWVRAGMRADRPPPDASHVYDSESRFAVSPWIPDADSHDAEGFSHGECPGDGKLSHPSGTIGGMAVDSLPTSYCVRLANPGVIMTPALRAHVGYWLSPLWALQAIARWQPVSGRGPLAATLFGGRVERRLTDPEAKGLQISLFAGATVGQIQLRPVHAQDLPVGPDGAPFVRSGMAGAHIGTLLRIPLGRMVRLFVAPELDLQFPDPLVHVDIAGGLELGL